MRTRKILFSLSSLSAMFCSSLGFSKDGVDVSWSGRLAVDYNINAVKPKDFNLTNGASLRAAELGLGVDFNNSISLNLDLDFSPDGVELGTAFVKFEDLFYNTDLLLGQVPTPFCQESSASSTTLPYFERSQIQAFKACIGPGFFLNHYQDFWAVQFGVRAAPFGHKVSTTGGEKTPYADEFTDHLGGALRVTGAPIMNDEMTLHVGASGSFQAMADGASNTTTFKANEVKGRNSSLMDFASELQGASLQVKNFIVAGVEVSPTYGPFQLESETLFNFVNLKNDLKAEMFWATQAGVNWVITGQKRKYDVKRGVFKGIERKNVGAFGVWQVAARYSHLDLSAKKNAEFTHVSNNVTGTLNWLPTDELRFGLEYVHSMRETTANENKSFGTLGLRMQVVF